MGTVSDIKKIIKELFRGLGLKIGNSHESVENTVVSLKTEHPSKGNVLLAYVLDPFLLKSGQPISSVHTHHFESTLLAKSYLNLGYDVDVISFRNRDFTPKKDYVFYINARDNFAHIASRLNKNCIKIVHLDTAHFLFNNYAASRRSLDLQKRRGVTIVSAKLFKSNWAIETADYATVLGNDFTIGTYSYAGTPIFPLPVPTPLIFNLEGNKNFVICRKNFLWFGSRGLIHKGLDLVLEAFVKLPEYTLTVCGPLDKEQDFVDAYHEELYNTANIRAVGWVDIMGDEFKRIINNCVALVYPSCAEGQAGSVINCMQGGLIPIVSYESGIDVNGYGLILENSSIDEVVNSIKTIAEMPAETLMEMSTKARSYVTTNHTGDKFIQENSKIIKQILSMEATKH